MSFPINRDEKHSKLLTRYQMLQCKPAQLEVSVRFRGAELAKPAQYKDHYRKSITKKINVKSHIIFWVAGQQQGSYKLSITMQT